MARQLTDGNNALAPNDPYNNMEGADYRPDFTVIDGGKSSSPSKKPKDSEDSNTNSANNESANNSKIIDFNQARNRLRNAENSALKSPNADKDTGFYTGNGKDDSSKKQKGKGKLKTKIAGMLIVLALTGGGIFLGTTNSMLAPAIEALVTESTDTQYAAVNRRTTRLIRYSVGSDEVVTATWTGAKKYNKMSGSFKKKLANQGITIDGSGKNTKFVYKNANDPDATPKTIPADDFEKTFKTDSDFREAFQTARRGRVATFFDNVANSVLQRLGVTRNKFNEYERTDDAEANTKKYRETMSEDFDGDSSNIKQKGENEVDKVDENGNVIKDSDGNPVKETIDTDASESASTSKRRTADAETKAKNMIDGVANKFAAVGSWTCTVTRVLGMLSVMVAANEIYQSIQYFSGNIESISKMKAGYGKQSPINEVLNFLTTSATTETNKYGKLTITDTGTDASGALSGTITGGKDIVTQTGSPLESNGMQMLLTGAALNMSENKLFSTERINNSFASTGAEETCMAGDAVSAIVSISVTIASLGTSAIASTVWSFVKGAVASVAISAALAFIIPTIAKTLFTNAFETTTGIPAGALFAKGASASNTRLGRNASGQSISSSTAAVAYNKVNQEVIALDAEIDRKNRSPFDITSKNTFLGSIAYSLMPVITSSKVTNLSSLMSTAGKSLSTLMSRSVSADGEGTSYMTKFGDCPTLKSIGAVGDVYCNPVTSTDVSTLNLDPSDPTYQSVINAAMTDETGVSTCDDDGENCKINPNSELAYYTKYCANRNSPFGVVDQNILGELQSTGGMSGTFRGIVGAIPIVGDSLDLLEAAENTTNMDWATGKKCGNTEDNKEFWNSKGKYYQRYIEDVRILEQLGAFEDGTNPISEFQQKYEAEHPLDPTDYVVYMSQISGLLPENVETVLAFIDYFEYINEYDPTERIAMSDHPNIVDTSEVVIARATEDAKTMFSNDNNDAPQVILAIFRSNIVYADIRNRSYAA